MSEGSDHRICDCKGAELDVQLYLHDPSFEDRIRKVRGRYSKTHLTLLAHPLDLVEEVAVYIFWFLKIDPRLVAESE